MIASAHRDSGFKNSAVRGRGWRVIRGGLGQAGHAGGAGRAPGTVSTPAGGALTDSGGGLLRVAIVNRDPMPAGGAGVTSGGGSTRTPPTNTQPDRTGGLQPPPPPANEQQNPPPPVTHPTCPTGTALDYYGVACVAVQGAPPSTQTVTTPPAPTCANGMTWDDTSGQCVSTTTTFSTYLPWVIGGAAVLLLLTMAGHR